MTEHGYRWAALVFLAALIFVTLSPHELRPSTGLPDAERLGAFTVFGALVASGFRRHLLGAILVAVLIAFLLEAAQHLVPGRHGRAHDFEVKAVAVALGAALVCGWAKARPLLVRRLPARR